MKLPKTYTNVNETGCCAVPNVSEWDKKEFTITDKQFIRMHTKSFLFMPLNMSKVMAAIQKTADDTGASMPPQDVMILSRDLSPWKAEQLYAVSKPVKGADNVKLSGSFLARVFEGPYKDAKRWHTSMQDYAKDKGKTVDKTYFFYTTCPKCAKHYGKNYVIGLVATT